MDPPAISIQSIFFRDKFFFFEISILWSGLCFWSLDTTRVDRCCVIFGGHLVYWVQEWRNDKL